MSVSKTTIKFAEKRGITVEALDKREKRNFKGSVWIWGASDMEPEACYDVYLNDSMVLSSCFMENEEAASKLPKHLRDEKELREVIAFIAKAI
jgi:hypothetical protein